MCEICGNNSCLNKCPNFIPLRAIHYCSICNDGICNGEEYLRNDNKEYIHWDCWQSCRDLVKWLGYEVKIMDENDE